MTVLLQEMHLYVWQLRHNHHVVSDEESVASSKRFLQRVRFSASSFSLQRFP